MCLSRGVVPPAQRSDRVRHDRVLLKWRRRRRVKSLGASATAAATRLQALAALLDDVEWTLVQVGHSALESCGLASFVVVAASVVVAKVAECPSGDIEQANERTSIITIASTIFSVAARQWQQANEQRASQPTDRSTTKRRTPRPVERRQLSCALDC